MSNMTFQVLISCMHEKDNSIVLRSNVQSDCLVINQCDINSVDDYTFLNDANHECHVKYINTTERGLSKSRNLAIRNAWADICLICDDDEKLSFGYENAIVKAYEQQNKADVIAFKITGDKYTREYPSEKMKLSFFELLRSSSQQITFKRQSVVKKSLLFDEKMGSGTGNGGGEETKFLIECKRRGLGLFYNPFCVASICKGDSQWFHGYTDKFFQNQGWVDRRILGSFLGFVYIFYWSIFRSSVYKKDGMTVLGAIKNSLIGYFSKR